MRFFFVFILLFTLLAKLNAQEDKLRRNVLSIESGFFHRGLLGVSYARNFCVRERTFMTASTYAGLGFYFIEYAGFGYDFNIGKGEAFFYTGVDVKVILPNDLKPLFVDSNYSMFAFEPHIGVNVSTHFGITVKFLAGYMFAKEPDDGFSAFPALGLSLGYAF
ncbi:MAG: hypothetical protein IPM74_17660 [Crocinitomicaceae bacterium]|nr:hypothetical protein [Crocinitomicaceae bacterium]MBK8927674.1 hypothetical protein [Crocinitomicaceae bacterium]